MKYKSIADVRNELGLTQSDMADELGITRQTYSKMEQNPENMTIAEARVVCSILGKRFEEIFFGQMFTYDSHSKKPTEAAKTCDCALTS